MTPRRHDLPPGSAVRVVPGGAVSWDVLDLDQAQELRVPGGERGLVVGYAYWSVRVLLPVLGLRWLHRGNVRKVTIP